MLTPREQGDFGELSAMQWLAWQGASVAAQELALSPEGTVERDAGDPRRKSELERCGEVPRSLALRLPVRCRRGWEGVLHPRRRDRVRPRPLSRWSQVRGVRGRSRRANSRIPDG